MQDKLMDLKVIKFRIDQLLQTGSMAYGFKNPQDDDRYCGFNEFNEIKTILVDLGVEINKKSSSSDHGIIFQLDGVVYNLFWVPAEQLENIRICTCVLTAIYRCGGPVANKLENNKLFRIVIFRVVGDILSAFGG